MNSTTVLEQVPRSQTTSGILAQAEADSARASFDSLMAKHAEVIPTVEWLSILPMETARENVRCLPMSVRIGKRIVDIVGALTLLILTSPIMLAAAILVKLTSPGPVIYSQTRVGLNLRTKKKKDRREEFSLPVDAVDRRKPGRDRRELSNFGSPFTIYKFRSMRNDSERNGAQFAQRGDARVTAIGLFMRRTRIDELPQLWNILKGDMSLIGPRPERPEFMQELQKHIPNFIDRLGLKPGLTGIAQVVNGYDNEIEGFRRKVSYDLLYLQNCCLWNDIKILFRTVRVVITGEGAL
jgi:lipopolysaccharide/colanic/teichoic acid biosynthesis glycosyltransferase